MGQTASQTTQDAIKPESISGPMPLARVRSPSRPRSYSGGGDNRQRQVLRRERRRSRDPTGSTPTSPVVDSPASASGLITSSIPETSTRRSSQTSQAPTQIRATRRRSSVTTTATAPPPYTAEPAQLETQLAEAPPPPVPPREQRDNAARRRSAHEKPPIEWNDEPARHRRTLSHSLAGPSSWTYTSSPSPVPIRTSPSPPVSGARARGRQMPPLISSSPPSSFSIEGSRAHAGSLPPGEEYSVAGGTPGIYSPYQSRSNTQLAPIRSRGSADYALSPRAPPSRRGSREDPLEMLRRYKTVMIVDDSSSMEGESWAEARDALAGLADAAAKYDQDGIDVHFLNDPRVGTNMKNGVEVKRLFDYVRPAGITPTGQKLEELLLLYMVRLEESATSSPFSSADALPVLIKPVNFIIITDGAPTDDPESVIVATARRLDEGHFPLMQVGIQFVQIGTAEDTAEALRELDDGLAQVHGIRDMVDTTPYTGSQFNTELLVKILLGGINRRVDRYGAAAVMD